MKRTVGTFVACVLGIALGTTALSAQGVALQGRGTFELDRLIRSMLRDGTHRLVVRDTVLAGSDTLTGPVLVVGASAYIEGVIDGDLVIIDANVFLRRTARVNGSVLNIAGGYFPAPEATVSGDLTDLWDAPYDVRRVGEDWRIVGTRRPATFIPDGFRGVRSPRYDRVDGFVAGLGAGLLLPPIGVAEPLVHAWAEYRTEPGELGGGASLSLLRGGFEVGVGAERVTATNEAWTRGPIHNGLSYVILGNDYRNYYAADRTYAFASWAHGSAADTLRLRLRFQREDAQSLEAADLWSIRQPDSVRPNPQIDPGRMISLIGSTQVRLRRQRFTADIGALTELGLSALGGEHEFARFEVTAGWAMQALALHTLSMRLHARGPLPGSDEPPHQRWSIVGGGATLETFDIGQFQGSRVLYLATEYAIPLPESLRLPIFGYPSLELMHMMGMAWTEAEDRALEHNIGIGIGTPFAFIRVITNPDDFEEAAELALAFRLPRILPWLAGMPPE